MGILRKQLSTKPYENGAMTIPYGYESIYIHIIIYDPTFDHDTDCGFPQRMELIRSTTQRMEISNFHNPPGAQYKYLPYGV